MIANRRVSISSIYDVQHVTGQSYEEARGTYWHIKKAGRVYKDDKNGVLTEMVYAPRKRRINQ